MAEIVSAIGAAIAIAAAVRGPGEPVTLTWYGSEGDGYLGARHGASWHGDACGLAEVVDAEGYGCAAPRWIPYCSRLVVCVTPVASITAIAPITDYNRCVVVTVVDRQVDDVIGGRLHVDLWPVPAEALGMVEVGIVEGWVYSTDHSTD